MSQPTYAELARVVRDHAGQLAASLVHLVGDFSAAEDLVQDAIEAALTHWPVEGILTGQLRGCTRWPVAAVWIRSAASSVTDGSWRWWRGRPSRHQTTDFG